MTLYDGSVTFLVRSTLEKDLGILIDCQLNFSEHMFAAEKYTALGTVAVCPYHVKTHPQAFYIRVTWMRVYDAFNNGAVYNINNL